MRRALLAFLLTIIIAFCSLYIINKLSQAKVFLPRENSIQVTNLHESTSHQNQVDGTPIADDSNDSTINNEDPELKENPVMKDVPVLKDEPLLKENTIKSHTQKPDKPISPVSSPPLALIFEDFENGLGKIWWREMANNTYSGTISSKYARKGKYSYRIELRRGDPNINNSKRSEIALLRKEPVGEERIYEFSTFLPLGGEEDYAIDPQGCEIIAQWHNTPDPGEEWTCPPLALLTMGNGQYVLTRYWDEDPVTTIEKLNREGKKARYALGSYVSDKGKWVDWKFHVTWGWLPSQKPSIQIFKNNVKILEIKNQPNTTNDRQGVYMKLGIYKWEWDNSDGTSHSVLDKRVIYYDNISIKQIDK